MRKKRVLIGIAVILTLLAGSAITLIYPAQRADLGWRPAAHHARFAGESSPTVTIDASHHNGSDPRWWGRYWPFANLLRADGYRVRTSEGRFDAASLAGTDVLVIANASGGAKPQFFGINLPFGEDGDRAATAFTAAEISAIRVWVEQGGGLLLIADHAPFGAANRELAAAFGVKMGAGFVELPDGKSDPLLFSRENHRLGSHAILDGGSGLPRINRVETFTGQSLQGPPGSSVLLALPPGSEEYVDDGRGSLKPVPALPAQGLAFEHARGRIVVLGEAAALTAQVADGQPFGMDTKRNQNEAFALAVLHWLGDAKTEHTAQKTPR